MAESSSNTRAPLLEEVLAGLHLEHRNPSTESVEMAPPQSSGSLCETKILYEGRSKCNCCINWVEQYPEDIKESAEETSDAKRYAILCRVQKAHGDSKKPLELHSIVVQSPLLKSVLGDVFTGYPGITTTLEEVKFCAPFWEFFYRWQALTKAQDTHESDALEHIRLLLNTLTSQLGNIHSIAKDLAQNNVITYDFLWTLFPPGTLVYSRLHDRDCLLEVKKTKYNENGIQVYHLQCRCVKWDGENFGWKTKHILISKFSGTLPIQDLRAYPITYHKIPKYIQSKLLERGHKYASLRSWHHKAYRGIIKVSGKSFFGSDKLHINERVIVDAEAFAQHIRSSTDLEPLGENEQDISDRLLMLCSPIVKAYGLRTKCWGKVYVDGISDIKWDENAFHNLVLENETKRLIESFVSAQMKQSCSPVFDDIVEGKGQGMILLLTGEPGVGKTLTAETVAEKACRPLYMVSASELGTSSHTSDVFLEQRTSDNLERNQLVSVFLRMLEYYRGILFLTTNRLSVFDIAFQSRIHLTLHYHSLDHVSRRKIWQVLLGHAQADSGLSKEDLVALAEEPINGRQIKNAVKAAKLLAMADDVTLSVNHINTVLRVMRNGRKLGAADS
ncbi:P-loop containing nucleoside triphosphate hydrolase protein [Biscogniauxia marginata]|nr:P-loop containing nucleoside triphosphate hydrolase protein [Biscogniauxia marginata]